MNIYLVYNKKIKAFIYFFVNFDAFGVSGYGSKMGLQATPLHSPCSLFLSLGTMKEKAKKLIEKYEELESELGNPDVLGDQTRYNKIHKQYKGIEKAVLKAKEYLQMMDDLDEYKIALGDSDPEMVAMAILYSSRSSIICRYSLAFKTAFSIPLYCL